MEGDAYYAIAAGQFVVFQDGRFIRRCERGEVIPGTASVIAQTDATVYKLTRESFVTPVLHQAAAGSTP